MGLANVKGIGWQGIADEVYGQPVRSLLPLRFHQRVFTLRKRAGEPELVGKHTPPYVYPLRLKEKEHGTTPGCHSNKNCH